MSSAAENLAAEAGWEMYIDSDAPPTRDEINEALASLGSPPVSQRMYKSYKKLVRYGYDHYVPINELDMAVKAERLGRAS